VGAPLLLCSRLNWTPLISSAFQSYIETDAFTARLREAAISTMLILT
jgi:hypothetical protein